MITAAMIALVVFALSSPPSGAAPRANAFSRATMGDAHAQMQPVSIPARIARVRVVPGSPDHETWGLGFSSAGLPGWGADGAIQQVVWMRYTDATGWALAGTPLDREGKPFNPTLSDFAITASGEGWAVGTEGTLLHKAAGSNEWIQDDQLGSSAANVTLNAVSLVEDAGSVHGFAVGSGATVYSLSDGRWSKQNTNGAGQDMFGDGSPELAAVAAVSGSDAWAVTGSALTKLIVYHYQSGTWHRRPTGQSIFDNPPAKSNGSAALAQSSNGSAVAADERGAWVGGAIYPSSAGHPQGDASNGVASRPFMIWIPRGGAATATSYCPDQYDAAQSDTAAPADQSHICDLPFPTSQFDVSSIWMVPGGDVFAGGFGLYRFSGDGWYREPDSDGYLISVSFASNDDGWVAGAGASYGAGGTIRSTSTTLGHWTAAPARPSVARWPQAQSYLLEAVATASDGSGRAVAAGQVGSALLFEPGAGWETINPEVTQAFHAVGWPAHSDPWALGEGGVVYRLDGDEWRRDPATDLNDLSLFGVAFNGTHGVAVGAGGTILRYDDGRWSLDPQSGHLTTDTLFSVTATGDGYVAAGAEATVIELRGGRWQVRDDVASVARHADQPLPTFYSAATLPDSRVLIGGSQSTLLAGTPGGTYERFPAPLEGTIVSLAAGGSRRNPLIAASVSPDLAKYRGDTASVSRASLFVGNGKTWRDGSYNRRVTLFTGSDSSAFEDPIYSTIVDPGSRTGWGVGGSPAGLKDDEGHFRESTTASVYRIDPDGDPSPPDIQADIRFAPGGVRFAVFGESWCGKGLCSASAGTGVMADEVALTIRDEINRAAAQPRGPEFVLFTGSMRAQGTPEELSEFHSYIAGFRIPVYAAMGTTDLVAGPTDAATKTLDSRSLSSHPTNSNWQLVFRDMRQPWGQKTPTPDIRPVPFTIAPTDGMARTHYAFDVMRDGKPVLRVAVVDSSTKSYGDASQQNPKNESQSSWLSTVLTQAQLQLGIPRVVVLNQPTFVPQKDGINWNNAVDQSDFERTVLTARVSAVFAGGARENVRSGLPAGTSEVPLYIFGGGGAPLGFEGTLDSPSKNPYDGFYHSWNLVDVDVAHPDLLGKAPIQVTPFPVLDSVAIHSFMGRVVRAGYAVRLDAVARGLLGGWSDPQQSRAQYITLGTKMPLPCLRFGPGGGSCLSQSAVLPTVRFWSRTPDIADFAIPEPVANRDDSPRRDGATGRVIRDPNGARGFLCTFKTGVAQISAQVGFHEARISILVHGGDGPCVDIPVPDAPKPPKPPPPPPPPTIIKAQHPFYYSPLQKAAPPIVFAPVPPVVVAPAPPGAPGVGRKEEHEYEVETEGHGDQSNQFTAVNAYAWRPQRHAAPVPAPVALLGGIALLAFVGAAAIGTVVTRGANAATQSERRRP